MISIIDIGVGDDVVVTLSIDIDLVVVVIVIVDVVVDVRHYGQNVHGGGKECHLCNVDSCSVCCSGTSRNILYMFVAALCKYTLPDITRPTDGKIHDSTRIC